MSKDRGITAMALVNDLAHTRIKVSKNIFYIALHMIGV